MTTLTDPNRYADAEFRAKARVSAVFLGEPGATEMCAALNTIDQLSEDDGEEHVRYSLDALLTDLDKWLVDPDPAEAYDKLLALRRELKELA
ncbi:hypothetical protein N9917_00210 [Deltaproteobacteria bacterium]|nr:hypothetical protein [Deltaproteobacteria bacterium]